jgi:ABC-type antimicrobial peptide transport system permease subunit
VSGVAGDVKHSVARPRSLLGMCGVFASLAAVPAIRASRVEPMRVLRSE